MKTYFTLKIVLLILIIFIDIKKSSAQLTITDGHYQIDKKLKLIICNEMPDKIPVGITKIHLDNTYFFSNAISSIKTGVSYEVVKNDTAYKLYFTRLPLVNLSAKDSISAKEIGGSVTITDTAGTSYSSTIGIKVRGAYSSTLPKKSYRVQLWSDTAGTTKDESIFGLRSDKRWLLLAMYNEKLRLNNRVSHDLWRKVHKLYYADAEPDAQASIRTRYVEVFLNNNYQGVYLFAEDMDRKELKLKKQTNTNRGGELYKGGSWEDGTLFVGVPNLPTKETEGWGGWELSYPDADQTDWKNIYNFTDFVVNASDSLFKQQISSKIREDNFVDYFIFLNLLRAEDNQGKNLFLARYNKVSPYFIAPWDLDGTWGYYWGGHQRNITDDILSNNLFNRLLSTSENFKPQLAKRWFALRANTFSVDSLYAAIKDNHTFLSTNGVYERENMVWAGDFLSYGPEELNYVKNWLYNRVAWLDNYFKAFAGDQPILYSFNASNSASGVGLNWSANCSAIQSFDVQTSADNSIWRTLTPRAILANDSTVCNYSFADTSIETTSLYYRLKIIAKNNDVSYSSSLYVALDSLPNTSAVRLFPNPVSTSLQIQGDVDKVTIYSLLGREVYEASSLVANTIDVQQLPTGMYVVRVREKNGIVSSHKIFVNR